MSATVVEKKRLADAAAAKPPVEKQRSLRIRVEIVTPEIATKWLEQNTSNRNIVQATVERYARDMKAGRWHLTGEPIQFGISGRLLNGQHRLWACIFSDTTFETVVVRGIVNEDEVVDVIDTGTKRTLGGAFQIHGEKDANLLASVVTLCWRYDTNTLTSRTGLTHEEGLEYLRENPGIRESLVIARAAYTSMRAQPTAAAAAYYLNARVDQERAEEFWRLVATGEGLTQGSPILAFRRWVTLTLAKREKPRAETVLSFAMKAMNQWRAGKTVRLLSVKADEYVPEVWKA